MRVLSVLAAAWLIAQPDPAADLRRMIAADRAFAAATRELGVRDGFLTFFAGDAIDVAPVEGRLALVNATERLRAQPPPSLPLITQRSWEPRWGAISGAGDLGWLTGPFTIHSVEPLLPTPADADVDRHGAYFSIWRRQPDLTYKVRLNIGIATARALAFPDGFTAASAPVAPAAPPPARTTPEAGIRLIEARFAESAADTVEQAYRAHLLPDARLHRNERSPFVGVERAATFMGTTFERMAWAVLHAEVAASDDLAFTAGSYEASARGSEGRPASFERGFFVRVWHRTAGGAWKIAFETNGIR